ncbi:MAG: hypothetical protein MI974_00440 [Chitinophagales bacterium]|nr:hypothetical protein [Chitinophagales bacterium]
MNLLIIYYNFPPVKVPGAIRLKNVYEQSLKYFQYTSVLTTSNRQFYQQDSSLTTNVKAIHDIPAYDLRRLLLSFRSNNTVQISTQSKKHFLYPIITRLIDSFPLNILIGDGGIVYIIKGYQKGNQLVKNQDITHLFSTFRPYSDHLIAYLLKRKYPHLYWIADFRDLHVDPANKNVIWPILQKKINRFFFHRANLITTVSAGLEKHLKYYGTSTHVLYNGISSTSTELKVEKSSPHFTITYTGSLFKDKRKPDRLLEGIQLLLKEGVDNVRINYAGKDSNSWDNYISRYKLDRHFVDYGFISLNEARQLQATTHINLLLTYSSSDLNGNLTGKLYEYFAARKPVIAIINGPQDKEIEMLFEKMNAGLVVYHLSEESAAQIVAFIKRYYEQWKAQGKVDYIIPDKALEQFRWTSLFENLMKCIKF